MLDLDFKNYRVCRASTSGFRVQGYWYRHSWGGGGV